MVEPRPPMLRPHYVSIACFVRVSLVTCRSQPEDEETGAALNPRGHAQAQVRAGVRPGGCASREAAAFLLDHGGFASVPPTALAYARDGAFNYDPLAVARARAKAAAAMARKRRARQEALARRREAQRKRRERKRKKKML